MTLDEPLRILSGALGATAERPVAAGDGRWQVLFGARARPLLLPVCDYPVQARCLGYFVPGGLRAGYARALLRANAALPGARVLREVALPWVRPAALIGDAPVATPKRAAIQIGTPGPYQKAAILLASERGEGLALAKVALVESADGMVAGEAAWLRALAPVPALAGQVPRLLGEGTAPNGRRYIVTTLAPSTATTSAFTPAHARFLQALTTVRREHAMFAASPYGDHLTRALTALEPLVAPATAQQLWDALADCRTALGGWIGPFVVAQGDFAPWNIRVDGDRVFVFDWEYARAGANPLADVFNFLLLPRALRRRAGVRALTATLARAAHLARELHPGRRWPPRVVAGLALAYLVEVLAHYSRANRRLDLRHPVMRDYWRLVETRVRWWGQ